MREKPTKENGYTPCEFWVTDMSPSDFGIKGYVKNAVFWSKDMADCYYIPHVFKWRMFKWGGECDE